MCSQCPSLTIQPHSSIPHITTIHPSVFIYATVYLTSNKHNCSSQNCLLVSATDDICSRGSWRSLVNPCGGITPPTQSCHTHDSVSVHNATKEPPLSHNAAEGGVGSHRYNSVLGEHLWPLVAGEILSWKDCKGGETGKLFTNFR